MKGLFEESDSLHMPIECFSFDAEKNYFPVKPHWHYFAELIYMLDGSARVDSGDDSYLLHKGELIIFHPLTVHAIYAGDGGMPKYAVLKFDINRFGLTPAYAPKLRDIFRYAQKTGRSIFFDAKTAERMDCGRIFSACMTELAENSYGYDLVLQTTIYGLLMSMIRCWLGEGMVIDSRGIPHEDDPVIDNITEYIDSSLSDNVRVSELAQRCNLSYSCFAQKFRERYGMSCKQYIERMRLYQVEKFLLFTDFGLNYICQETGFTDCSHLIKSFKKYKGVTPKQFRLSRQRAEEEAADGGSRREEYLRAPARKV